MATGFHTQVGNGEYRLQFETDNREYYLLMQEVARRCVDGRQMTNADRILAMSDDELATVLIAFTAYLGNAIVAALMLIEKIVNFANYADWIMGGKAIDWLRKETEDDHG